MAKRNTDAALRAPGESRARSERQLPGQRRLDVGRRHAARGEAALHPSRRCLPTTPLLRDLARAVGANPLTVPSSFAAFATRRRAALRAGVARRHRIALDPRTAYRVDAQLGRAAANARSTSDELDTEAGSRRIRNGAVLRASRRRRDAALRRRWSRTAELVGAARQHMPTPDVAAEETRLNIVRRSVPESIAELRAAGMIRSSRARLCRARRRSTAASSTAALRAFLRGCAEGHRQRGRSASPTPSCAASGC